MVIGIVARVGVFGKFVVGLLVHGPNIAGRCPGMLERRMKDQE